MKSATIPSIRVEPELREQAEGVHRRRTQAEFVARGLASLADARESGVYIDAATSVRTLRAMLAAAKAQSVAKKSRGS